LISKSPELHRQDLEILPPTQVAVPQSLREDFHFSCHNYGDYCLFLLSIYSFPLPPSHRTFAQRGTDGKAAQTGRFHLQADAPASHQVQSSDPAALAPARVKQAANRLTGPGIQKYVPLFHPHREAEGEYNQSRRRDRPFRLGRNVL
jgi:hypothetical protein